MEVLEPRVLLSADCLPPEPVAPLEAPPEPSAVVVDLDHVQRNPSDDSATAPSYFTSPEGRKNGQATLDEPIAGATVIPADPTAPALRGLELIDSNPAPLAGQIIYLDFDGAEEVLYHGPITLGPFEVPAFQAPDAWAGQEQTLIRQTLADLEQIFAGSGVIFTTSKPSGDQPYSTIYIGGDDTAFAPYGSFLGLAEQVDVGNANRSDMAMVFPMAASLWAPGQDDNPLARLIAHEAGHLLGYAHAGLPQFPEGPPDPLADVAAAYTLTVTATNGSVTVNPIKKAYQAGDVVKLIPRPDTGYSFAGWSGDAQSKSLALDLTMNSDKNIVANFSPWTPPIGVPTPDFGIFETHYMYVDQVYDFGSGPEPYKDAGNGPYTHYVDNTDPNATDIGNPYGTVDRPRLTIPRTVAAGSVVEIHGGPYDSNPKWNGSGTAQKPIFYRGPAAQDRPRISVGATVGFYGYQDAAYIIFENLHFYNISVSAYRETHHIAIRNSEVEGSLAQSTTAGIGIGTPTAALPEATVHHTVVYNNEIHTVGDWQASGDPDGHGIAVTDHVNNVWILDNLLYHNSGNGVQVNAGNLSLSETTHHIYLGRNQGYENKQDMLWTKSATDVVFSENVAWNHQPSDSSLGGGMGLQYGPVRVWFLFNEIYDCTYGIRMSTDDGGGGEGPGTDTYVIGNLIHDIHRGSGTAGLDVWKGGAAIFIASEVSERSIFLNTIYHTDAGILNARRATLTINDNIFSEVSEEHVFFEFPDSRAASDLENNLFDAPARIVWGRTADLTTYSLSSFNSAYPGKADGSMEADPLFVDSGHNNFHLRSTSPAVDAGLSSVAVQTAFDKFNQLYGLDIRKDMEGRARPQDNKWDFGAYEYFLSPIVDAAVSGRGQDSLTLTWTVPGEQGVTGVPTGYDIRYASNSITEANWAAAMQVTGEPIAGTFGQRQSFVITGLDPGRTYYAAIKILDEMKHVSPLSNVVSATTTAPVGSATTTAPEITVLGQGLSIADGDTSPRLTDGTDFGKVAVGGPAITRTFTVRNDGGGTLILGPVVVPAGFTLVEGLAASLAPGASDTFTVRLNTAVAGIKTGDIVFTNNDPNESPYNFRITGIVGPEITVLGQGLSIADGDTSPRLTDGTDFGKVAVGGPAITRTFTVRNDGGGTLILGPVVVPAGFTLVEGLAASLAPGASDTFTVRLNTAVAGIKTGDIVFTNNDPNESPYNFRITGIVGPEITVLGQGLSIADGDTSPRLTDGTDFGKVAVGGPAITRTFTVRNDGGGTLILGPVVVPAGFTLVEGLAASLAPGASDTFTVRLNTAVAGIKTGDIVFTNNDPNESPYNFRITGTVV